jgi:Ca-activated chloride channel family protein
MRLHTIGLVVSLLMLGGHPASQANTGSLSGTVRSQRGSPVSGAVISLSRSGVLHQAATTDSRGEFQFKTVAVQAYDLTVRAGGFADARQSVQIVAGKNPPMTIVLESLPTAPKSAEPSATQAEGRRRDPSGLAGLISGALGTVMRGAPERPPYPSPPPPSASPGFHTEAYDRIHENGFRRVLDHPLSTFSVDVDTASYSNVRRFLLQGELPPADAVRLEELVNYFRFDYPAPKADVPFSITTELAPCPWNAKHKLALIGLQGKRLTGARTPDRNLVFLLDVSGSMTPANKLPLVKTAMKMLVDTLTERDRVGIVVYAGASGVVLPPTRGSDTPAILQALEGLSAGGSTNGAAGIHAAYDLAATAFIKGGINRVILATDGDFNVGVTSQSELLRLIEEKRATGIFLSVLGVGEGNLKDSTMEKLADAGNGNYAYLDSLHEARRVLIEEAGSTLVTIAKDVKVQVEFNPKTVGVYRLIGYENRVLQNEDFNNDAKDAGEIGAGHSVTALYEIVSPGVAVEGMPTIDPLRYQQAAGPTAAAATGELMSVKLRYKAPDGDVSRLVAVTVPDRPTGVARNLGFAASVAAFGMLLRQSEHRGDASYLEVLELARNNRGEDPRGYRAEFIRLVQLASALDRPGSRPHPAPPSR